MSSQSREEFQAKVKDAVDREDIPDSVTLKLMVKLSIPAIPVGTAAWLLGAESGDAFLAGVTVFVLGLAWLIFGEGVQKNMEAHLEKKMARGGVGKLPAWAATTGNVQKVQRHLTKQKLSVSQQETLHVLAPEFSGTIDELVETVKILDQ